MNDFDDVLKQFESEDSKKMDDAIDVGRALMTMDMNPITREFCFAGILNWQFDIKSDNYHALSKKILSDLINDPSRGGSSIQNFEDLSNSTYSYYENGSEKGYSTGFKILDDYYTLSKNQLNVITGIPTHGKSEFMDQLIINTLKINDWKWLIFSPENYPLEFHMDKLLSKLINKPFRNGLLQRMSKGELIEGMERIKANIDFIHIGEYGTSLDSILFLAKMKKYDGLIIDPWNEMENKRRRGQAETDWIGENLAKIRRWARANNTGVWVVAHPTKMRRIEGSKKFEVPSAYDIKGSAEWYNRADNILTVYREEDQVEIYIQKVKFKTNGKKGMVPFRYDAPTGTYIELEIGAYDA